MTTSTPISIVAPCATRENTRAALAAALAGAYRAASPPGPATVPDDAAEMSSSVNGLLVLTEDDKARQLAAAQATLRTASTVRELATVIDAIQPGRDASRGRRLQYWVERLGDTPIADVSTDQVDAVLAELETEPGARGKPRAGATVNRYRASFASLVKFARKHRRVPRGWISPLADLPMHKESPGKLRYLSEEEETRLMAAAALQVWPLLPLLIRMGIVTGMRKGSLVGLTWGDINFTAATAQVERTKSGAAHMAPLTPDVVAALKAVRPARATDLHLVFGNAKNPYRPHCFTHAFMQAVKTAGLAGTGVTFHTLRHTSCSRLAQAGRSLLEIADHATHRNLSTTRRYAHLSVTGRASMVHDVFSPK